MSECCQSWIRTVCEDVPLLAKVDRYSDCHHYLWMLFMMGFIIYSASCAVQAGELKSQSRRAMLERCCKFRAEPGQYWSNHPSIFGSQGSGSWSLSQRSWGKSWGTAWLSRQPIAANTANIHSHLRSPYGKNMQTPPRKAGAKIQTPNLLAVRRQC